MHTSIPNKCEPAISTPGCQVPVDWKVVQRSDPFLWVAVKEHTLSYHNLMLLTIYVYIYTHISIYPHFGSIYLIPQQQPQSLQRRVQPLGEPSCARQIFGWTSFGTLKRLGQSCPFKVETLIWYIVHGIESGLGTQKPT